MNWLDVVFTANYLIFLMNVIFFTGLASHSSVFGTSIALYGCDSIDETGIGCVFFFFFKNITS